MTCWELKAPAAWLATLTAALLLAAPTLPVAGDVAGTPFDWTLGAWEGTRRDGADGSEEPMTMRVEAILGGAGLTHHLEIVHSGGTYRGFSVQVHDPKLGRWVRQYINATNASFVRLEGEVDGDGSIWRSTGAGRKRDSRLVSQRLPDGGWRRTLSVSEDGGSMWRVLWIDVLRRPEPEPAVAPAPVAP
jgi:hypothetical protein